MARNRLAQGMRRARIPKKPSHPAGIVPMPMGSGIIRRVSQSKKGELR
jgi:hypothetical protein